MPRTLQELKEVVAELPSSERAELAQFLLRSLDEEDENVVRADWLKLAKQRMDDVRAGNVVGISAATVLKNLLRPT